MMEGDLVNTEWAKAGRERIQCVIEEVNQQRKSQTKDEIRIVWGNPDLTHSEVNQTLAEINPTLRNQNGLLGDDVHDVRVSILHDGKVRFFHWFKNPRILNSSPKEIFNVLTFCARNELFPIIVAFTEDNQILIYGLEVMSVSADALTGEILEHFLVNLRPGKSLYEQLGEWNQLDEWALH